MKNFKFDYIFFSFVIILILLVLAAAAARAQTDDNNKSLSSSGGAFVLEKSVIAGGGDQSSQSPVNLAGTNGQSVAGHKSSGGGFSLYSGFWNSEDFAPTAVNVVAGGQVKTADNRGIQNALVTVIFSNGERKTAKTTSFGYYRFSDIPAGEVYIFTVSSKRFRFPETTRIRAVLEDTDDIDFTAFENSN